MDIDIEKQINDILNKNKLDDLHKFISKRSCLNQANQYLNYIFHFIQACGILTVSVAQSYELKYLTWVGIGLNTLASVIHILLSDNKKVNKQLLGNIKSIKLGDYLDESVIDLEDDKSLKKSHPPSVTSLKKENIVSAFTHDEISDLTNRTN